MKDPEFIPGPASTVRTALEEIVQRRADEMDAFFGVATPEHRARREATIRSRIEAAAADIRTAGADEAMARFERTRENFCSTVSGEEPPIYGPSDVADALKLLEGQPA